MIRMQIQFTEDQARALKRAAAGRGVSIAALTREAVDRALLENGVSTSAEGQAKVLEVMSRFRSDRTDVAENHDLYLEEIYDERG